MTAARRRFGQHFLEPAWVTRLVDTIDPDPTDTFLEIGSGRGAVTLELARRARHVTAVEIDPRLVERLNSRAPVNVSIIKGDFLRLDLEQLTELSTPARAVGNLPYNVASPILIKLMRSSADGTRFRDATVMLQHEVADRVTAEPGSSDWGPLAVVTRLHGEARRVLSLPPGAFRPMPRVRSAVVHLRFRPSPIHVSDPTLFDLLVRALFTQRRKTALNALRPFVVRVSRLSVQEVFARTDVDPGRRPGELDLSELAELSEVLASSRL